MENTHNYGALSSQFFGKLDDFKDLVKTEMYNYLLKCTDGIHKGMFLYMNTTPDGESFGSGDPDKLTMYIEGGDLDEEHAEIRFEKES